MNRFVLDLEEIWFCGLYLYEELKNDNEGGKLTKSGNKITWVQSPDEYEDLTVDAVKFTYELLKGAHK